MSEEVRALLAANCASKRLQVRTAQTLVLGATFPANGQMVWTYEGNGIFYPQSAFATCLDTDGQIVNAPTDFEIALLKQYKDQIFDNEAFPILSGNFNSYKDILNYGYGLVGNQYYTINYTVAFEMTVCVTFVGTEFLFANIDPQSIMDALNAS
jgi:hypothetical protein